MNAVNPLARFRWPVALAAALALAMAPAAASAVSPAPAWKLRAVPLPTNFVPGAVGGVDDGPQYLVTATNVGAVPTSGPVTITDTLPTGLTPVDPFPGCSIAGQTVTCVKSKRVNPGAATGMQVPVAVSPGLSDPSTLTNEVSISGGGALALPMTASIPTSVTSVDPPFGLLDGDTGLGAVLNEADGSPATAAGSHPSLLSVYLAFNSKPGNSKTGTPHFVVSDGGARDVYTLLPPGLMVDPTATPVRCTEALFEVGSCPSASVAGTAATLLGFGGGATADETNLYNLVPPPGSAAAFGFNPVGQGAFIHILGGVHPGDYRLSGGSEDVDALFFHQFYGIQLQFWGDPSGPSHQFMRGDCLVQNQAQEKEDSACPIPPQKAPLLSTPTSCSASLPLDAEADSWLEPGKWLTRSVSLTDLEVNPVGTSGCNAIPFKPTLSVQPTTNLTDSPSGLNVELKVPQTQKLNTTASAHLKKAVVTLPEGLVVNPSSANGLDGCSSAQIGIDPNTGIANGSPNQCPSASKIGAVEVESPLLAQYDSEQKVQRDPEGNTIPEPISGSVFIAAPHDNPFKSLLAIYIAFEDPKSGVIVKLAGHVVADPQTGRLTTTFDNGPQLPFSEFRLHFFGGAGAALRTPLTCGIKTISSVLTPWSSPEGHDENPSDSFQTAAVPGGGPCPQTEAAATNAPAFSAGTLAPQAGAYSPLVLKLAREDGSAPIAAIDTTLAPGLTGKLAGIAYCPEGALAAAAAKTGNQEKSSPSCPASSEVGSVVVGAGAGPTPYYTTGTAYLAGPYKSAPLSLAIITPATAGPYDLGTVVVRTALYVDPESARIHAVSDPIPQILQGIPLDVRSIALRMDRPTFTLNPTSCDPMAITGFATSPFGSSTPLNSPFQVGGCPALPFKPKLSLALSGGTKRSQNPALRAVLTYPKAPYANIAKASVALPHSEFLDQSHIKTICTRVQFAANQCPAGSIYGKATAITPLLDQPLSGPVYLRSSSHPLPDLVADLNGQIHVVLVGRIDSVKGGIRNTFEAVPDAPVSKFVLEMQGGKKGLLENSRNLCKSENRATVLFDGQNGKTADSTPKLKVKCPKAKRGKH